MAGGFGGEVVGWRWDWKSNFLLSSYKILSLELSYASRSILIWKHAELNCELLISSCCNFHFFISF